MRMVVFPPWLSSLDQIIRQGRGWQADMPGRLALARLRPSGGWVLCGLLLLAACRGFLYSQVVPLWQAPDEPGHFEYACLLGQLRRPPARADAAIGLEQAIIASMDRADFWRLTRQTPPDPLPGQFRDSAFLRRSGSQLGDEPPAYYLIPALLCSLSRQIETQARSMRWYSVGLLVCATWLAWQTARRLWPDERWLIIGPTAFYALAPMPTFIGMAINNDILALVAGTAWCWALVNRERRGDRTSFWLLAGAAGAVLLSKRTALFLAPVTLLALWKGPSRRLCLIVVVLALSVGVGLSRWRSSAAEAWRAWPEGGPALRTTITHAGHYALAVTDSSPAARSEVSQPVIFPRLSRLRGKTVVLTGWVRTVQRPAQVTAAISDGSAMTTSTRMATPEWQQVIVTHTVSMDASYVRVAFGIGRPAEASATGDLVVDDVQLELGGQAGNLLRNAGAEQAGSRLQPAWDLLVRFVKLPREWPAVLLSADSYAASDLERYAVYAALTFAGFWGNFGWLQLPLPLPAYLVLAIACAASMAGWLRMICGRSRPVLAPWQGRALSWMSLSVLLALLQVFLPMIGRDWQPQGRYLFPALWPLSTLLLLGLGAWFPGKGRRILLLAWLVGLALLDGAALFGTLLPAYDGIM